jgi:hypothetical protein
VNFSDHFHRADSYDEEDLLYVWDEDQGVKFLGDVELSQFDLISSPYRNASISRKRGILYTIQRIDFRRVEKESGNRRQSLFVFLR